MSPVSKEPLVYIVASVAAIVIGVWIADGTWIALAIAAGAVVLAALGYVAPKMTHVATLGVLIIGYIVGNRGFAQLTPASGAPLFPAELGLALSGTLLIAQCCVTQRVPVLRDALNFSVLLWIAFGTARIAFDVKTYGFTAIRDFALVYYALFLFIAQTTFADRPGRSRWLHRCLLWATAPLPILLYLFDNYTDFFTQVLTVRGIPLIFYKGDLIGTFITVGSVVWYIYYAEDRRRWWALGWSLVLAATVLTTDNRASLLALVVTAVWLGIGRRWQFLGILAGGGAAAMLVLILWSQFAGQRLEQTPLGRLYENVASVTDFGGTRHYSGVFQKGDNNRFRLVWWRTSIEETIHANPWVGMGFGYDLAEGFLKEYYPDSTDEFNVRSPHNVWVTIFARMGLLGLLGFAAIVFALARATLIGVRSREPHHAVPWCVGWAILTASTFGVVLEGPMGGVVFWIVLGIGNAENHAADAEIAAEETVPDDTTELPLHRAEHRERRA